MSLPRGRDRILPGERPSGTRSLELAIETVAVVASFPAVGVIPAQEALAGMQYRYRSATVQFTDQRRGRVRLELHNYPERRKKHQHQI